MHSYLDRVQAAIDDLKNGKMVILSDDPSRENEGDLVFPAEKITEFEVNFMIRHGTGIVCLSLEKQQADKMELNFMVPPDTNSSPRGTPFTIPIDAAQGITTGVSAQDRAHTIRVAASSQVTASHVVKPGHVFPLIAKSGGVLQRAGHTEGAVDLMKLAHFSAAAVICEIMNPDGSMASGEKLQQFAEQHQLNILSISDLIAYRFYHENQITEEESVSFPLEDLGEFDCSVLLEKYTQLQHLVFYKKPVDEKKSPLVRIHSSCLTGDVFHSLRCDCHNQLQYSLKQIYEQGGFLFYLNQEGRGIGLINKIKAYILQQKGFDTVEANQELGEPIDARDFYLPAYYLRQKKITHIRLLTNNPLKVDRLHFFGIEKIDVEHLPVFMNQHNKQYLRTKQEKLGHFLRFHQQDGEES